MGAGAVASSGGGLVVQAESASADKAATLTSNPRSRSDALMKGLLKATVEPERKAAPSPHNGPCSTRRSFRLCFKLSLWGQQITALGPGFGGLRRRPVPRTVASRRRPTRALAMRRHRPARVFERRRLV